MRLLFLAVPLLAQISPELHPNQSATFRLLAPKATAVTLWADWMPNAQSQPLAKDPNGLWSLTTGPLEPGGHLYWFNLDGLPIADPINPVIKLRQRTSASIVEIPSPTPAPWDLKDVPHGTVITEWRHSKTLGRTERVFLYLPPGYEGGSTRYPVLYLIHGKGDIPDSWTNAGRANFILDNLIASKKARSMILVMPAGHAAPYDPAHPPPPPPHPARQRPPLHPIPDERTHPRPRSQIPHRPRPPKPRPRRLLHGRRTHHPHRRHPPQALLAPRRLQRRPRHPHPRPTP